MIKKHDNYLEKRRKTQPDSASLKLSWTISLRQLNSNKQFTKQSWIQLIVQELFWICYGTIQELIGLID